MTKKKDPRQGSSKAPPLTLQELRSHGHGRPFKMEEFMGNDFLSGYSPEVISQPGEWITIPVDCEIVEYLGNTSPELNKGRVFLIRQHHMAKDMKDLKIRERILCEAITEMKTAYRTLEDKHQELLDSLAPKSKKGKTKNDIRNR